MSDTLDWNAKTIAEFRANQGKVGGNFEGAPMVLVHHRGRNSGREYVNPMMYLPHDSESDIIYVFATKAGAPTNPDWYHNLTAAGDGSVERGTETYKVTVRVLTGAERDRIYAEQARRYPGFAEYARQTAGIRTIPVLELTRAQPTSRRPSDSASSRSSAHSRDGSVGTTRFAPREIPGACAIWGPTLPELVEAVKASLDPDRSSSKKRLRFDVDAPNGSFVAGASDHRPLVMNGGRHHAFS